MNVITAENISKTYRGRALYRNAAFTIQPGTITGIEGPNGSGKSVLFRLLCGFTRPDSGTITVAPEYLSPGRTYPDHFGILIDRPGYLPGLTGLDNLLALANIRRRITDTHVKDTMQQFGLDPSLTQRVRNYSLGMKQKLALSQAFMENPRVLLLDEPFNALDVATVATVKQAMRDFRRDGGTIIFTSHTPTDIPELADRTLRLSDETVTDTSANTLP